MKRLMDMTIEEIEALGNVDFDDLNLYAKNYDIDAERSTLKKRQFVSRFDVFDEDELTLEKFIKAINHEVDRLERGIRDTLAREGWLVKERIIKREYGYDYEESYYDFHVDCERLETDEEVLKRLKKNFKGRLTKLRANVKNAIKREEKERLEFERLKKKFEG